MSYCSFATSVPVISYYQLMKRHDSDDSQVAAKLQRFDLSGKALYENQLIFLILIFIIIIIMHSVMGSPVTLSIGQCS